MLTPNFALTVDEVVRRVAGGRAIAISARSSLLLDGDVELSSLSLDGALSIRACWGARVVVRGCAVTNDGCRWLAVDPAAPPQAVGIRGYGIAERSAGLQLEVTEPGEYEVSGNGVLRRLSR